MKFAFVVKSVASVVFSRKLICNHSCTGKAVPFLITRKLQVLSSLRSQHEAPAWGSKKHKNKQKFKIQYINIMADPKIEEILAPFRAAVKEQVIFLLLCSFFKIPRLFFLAFLKLFYFVLLHLLG